MFLFPSVAHVFSIAPKLQNPNLPCRCGHRDNSGCKLVRLPFLNGLCLLLKFVFRFRNVENFTTNFTF